MLEHSHSHTCTDKRKTPPLKLEAGRGPRELRQLTRRTTQNSCARGVRDTRNGVGCGVALGDDVQVVGGGEKNGVRAAEPDVAAPVSSDGLEIVPG